MADKGQALSDGSFPIKDKEDLQNAIHAVGRATNNSAETVRKHIMARAEALGLSSMIPDTWNKDGSLSQNSASDATEKRTKKELRSDVQGLKDCILSAIQYINAGNADMAVETLTSVIDDVPGGGPGDGDGDSHDTGADDGTGESGVAADPVRSTDEDDWEERARQAIFARLQFDITR
jgi:hypothetical protein